MDSWEGAERIARNSFEGVGRWIGEPPENEPPKIDEAKAYSGAIELPKAKWARPRRL